MNITRSLKLPGDDPHGARPTTAAGDGPRLARSDPATPDGLAFEALLTAHEAAPAGAQKHVNRPPPAVRKSAPAPRGGPEGPVVPLPVLPFNAPPDLAPILAGDGASGSSTGASHDPTAAALDSGREVTVQTPVDGEPGTDGPMQGSAEAQARAPIDATADPAQTTGSPNEPRTLSTPLPAAKASLSKVASTEPHALATSQPPGVAIPAQVGSREPRVPATAHAPRLTIPSMSLPASANRTTHEPPAARASTPEATRPEARPPVADDAPSPARSGGSPRVDDGGESAATAPDAGMATTNPSTGGRGTNQRSAPKDKVTPAPSSDPRPIASAVTTAAATPSATAAQPSGGDKNLTAVSLVSPAKADRAAPADAATAVRSAQNQLVMRHTATGELVHPELGRVQVSAHLKDGAVDVRVAAQHAETAVFLAPRADAMASDARAANVPVTRVDVESHGGRAEHPPTGSGDRDTRDGRHTGQQAWDGENAAAAAPPTKRVRIVL